MYSKVNFSYQCGYVAQKVDNNHDNYCSNGTLTSIRMASVEEYYAQDKRDADDDEQQRLNNEEVVCWHSVRLRMCLIWFGSVLGCLRNILGSFSHMDAGHLYRPTIGALRVAYI